MTIYTLKGYGVDCKEAWTTKEEAEKAKEHFNYCRGCEGSRVTAYVAEIELHINEK